ncbi:putative sensor domain DACNV-containing protein [Dyadobacter tibetensis]|uniref:putative sensor domain DACNV-containing protein n=1 Tax=Dyadobacter tibetensis TaxID=1211851 RepID=UPI0004721D68|nr:hypothetical protein [Dyadobacter tibetensis]
MTLNSIIEQHLGDNVPFSTYQAARGIAGAVEAHFRHHHEISEIKDGYLRAPAPDAKVIETLLDTTFWASLRREEGYSPKISIAFLPPNQAGEPLILGRHLPFTPHSLTKLAPAVERSGIHLGVWRDGDNLYIWGTTRIIPSLCFVLEVIEPGVLVIKHRRGTGFGKFVNVAVLSGDQVKLIDERSSRLPDCPSLIHSLMGNQSPELWNDSMNTLVLLSASMRAHGRGGILLVLPVTNTDWKESIVHPITYPVEPSFSALAQLTDQQMPDHSDWQNSMSKAISSLAGLTAVDGATIINEQYELMAFGAKIARGKGRPHIEEILITEPIRGSSGRRVSSAQIGGTRHLSAAQFVFDQKDAMALVASQDGRFTIFSWSSCEEIVQAHRVDVLLM